MDSVQQQVLDSWRRHHRINTYFLDHLPEPYLSESPEGRQKTIASLFAHVHQVRRMWLQVADPVLWEGTEAMDKKQIFYKHHLKRHLEDSALAIEGLLKKGLEVDKIKGFKLGPVNFLSYLISHESHHRGQAIWTLRNKGVEISDALAFGIWDWGKR